MKRLLTNLAIVLTLGIAASMASCSKDYDNDIKMLNEQKADKEEIEKKLAEQVALIQTQIATLETEVKNYADQQDAALLNQVRGELEDLQSLLEKAIEDLDKKQQDALEKAVDDLTEYIDGKLVELGNKIDGVDDRLNLLTLRVETLEGKVDALEAYDEYLLGLIDALGDEDEEIKASIETLREQLQKQISDLSGKVDANKTELLGKIAANTGALKALSDKLDAAIAKVTADVAQNTSDIAALGADLSDLKEKYNSLASKVKEHDSEIAGILETLNGEGGVIEQLTDAKKEINRLKRNLRNNYYTKEQIDGMMGEVNTAIEELGRQLTEATKVQIKNLRKRIKDVEGSMETLNASLGILQGTVSGLSDTVEELGVNVDNLMARIQSITFVPEFADGKGTLDVSTNSDGTAVEDMNPVTLTYQVYPAEAAAAIANAFATDTEGFSLAMVVNKVVTRALSNDIITFEIGEVTADADGLLTVEAAPTLATGQDAAFLATNTAFQVALKLTTDKGDVRQTEFVEVLKKLTTEPFDDPDPVPEIDLDELVITNAGEDGVPHYAPALPFPDITQTTTWFAGDIDDTDLIIIPTGNAGAFVSSAVFQGMGVSNAAALGLDPGLFVIQPSDEFCFYERNGNSNNVNRVPLPATSIGFDEDLLLKVLPPNATSWIDNKRYAIFTIDITYDGTLIGRRFVVCQFLHP